jgi:nitroimidazol reductase NimA-like FMN-containing flavoprotein (pyridoxamine 5'-phosphate oxidase superfamily)
MRRSDREISDKEAIDDIVRRCKVCRLAMCHDGQPYIVPLSFGYDGHFFYFHAASEGRKVEMLRANSQVCFELDILHDVVPSNQACNWSMKYESVIGIGVAEILAEADEKRAALGAIMRQYSASDWSFGERELEGFLVFRVRIEEIKGKARQ